ncbi:hypothetical protein [Spirillospora sp. CA-294931]|uniref:hypothetical protein n=1 Tax=Spirillospora sp. CA-294931 TaxID=3240042 RepID=UPI003D8E291F
MTTKPLTAHQQKVRDRLGKHRRYHLPAQPDCLQCGAAELLDALAGAELFTRLAALTTVAEQASQELTIALDLLHSESPAAQSALASIASSRVPADAIASVTGQARDAAHLEDLERKFRDLEGSYAVAQERLERIAAVHTRLVRELPGARFRYRDVLERLTERLARAWHGHEPADPKAPLTKDPA